MSAREKIPAVVSCVETAEVQSDLLSVIIHDLGAIASALAMRTDVLAKTLPAADHAALRAIGNELTEMKRTLRLMRGPRGSTALAPDRQVDAARWLQLATHLAAGILPRTMRINTEGSDTMLDADAAHVITFLWLSACKALPAGVVLPQAATLQLAPRRTDGAKASGAVVSITVEVTTVTPENGDASAETPGTRSRASRWQRFATRVARRNAVDLQWWTTSGGRSTWQCSIG